MSRTRRQTRDPAPVQQVIQRLKIRPELANIIINEFAGQNKGHEQRLSLLHAFFRTNMLSQYKAQVLMMMHRKFDNVAVLHALLDPNRQRPQREAIVFDILASVDQQEFLLAIEVERKERYPARYQNTTPHQLTNSAKIISEIYRVQQAVVTESKISGEAMLVGRLTALIDSLREELSDKSTQISGLKKQINQQEIVNVNISNAFDALAAEFDAYKQDAEEKLSAVSRELSSARAVSSQTPRQSPIGTPLADQEEPRSLSRSSSAQNNFSLFNVEPESGSGWQIVMPVAKRPHGDRHGCLSPQQFELGSSQSLRK
ncbi:MAG: hypothetical protein P1U63_12170 [Coxiellaceae bacterium]|nr:hypothetical protein [Coxiellaceae bacterium]